MTGLWRHSGVWWTLKKQLIVFAAADQTVSAMGTFAASMNQLLGFPVPLAERHQVAAERPSFATSTTCILKESLFSLSP